MTDGRLTLLYDGECEFCTRMARWVERRDRSGRVSVRRNGEPGLIESQGLSRAQVDRAAWAVEAGGRKFEGAAAVNRVLRDLGGGWRLLASLYWVPPLRWVEDRYYRRVARRRAWW
ncbi:MAG TPA: DCC1-like thiol-disulfide oxidoreductase family protein [Candidatus Dormibacteraeota bacterium]|jgi:predicted DCC family thiol-disulfide oxidoreductase YuxK